MKSLPRLAARFSVFAAVIAVGSLVAVQYEGIVVRYMTLSHEVDASRAQIAALQSKLVKQRNDVRRLRDPNGAIPEIHDRLKEVGPNEEIIILRGVPSPAPGAWESSR
jgi:hypothetical protein